MNEKQKPFIIQTDQGDLEIPTDEHWRDYSAEERQAVIDITIDTISNCENGTEDVRQMIAEDGLNVHDFSPPTNFEKAKRASNGTVIMEGDWGGQIYLSCPMKHVNCSRETLQQLLKYLNNIAWDCNEGDGTLLRFQRQSPGDEIWGGMGGGKVVDGLWIHEEFEAQGLRSKIDKVLSGKRTKIEK